MTDSSAAKIPADSPKKPRKPRPWSRRLAWLFGTLVVLALIFRLVLPLLFPMVLKKLAAGYNLQANYERSEMSLLSGDVGLWHLTLTPNGQTEPVFEAGYIRGNISTLRLLALQIEVWRAEADGVNITIERDKDGRFPVLEQILSSAVAKNANTPAKTTSATKFDLVPPVQIDALRLTNVKTIFRDKSTAPPFVASAVMNIRLSDVGSLKRPCTFEFVALSDSLVDQIRVQGVARGDASKVDADGFVVVRGLDLQPIAGYLSPLGIKPVSRSISASGSAKLRVATTQSASALDVGVNLSAIKLESEGGNAAAVDSIAVAVDSVNGSSVNVSSIRVDGVRANATRSAAGQLRFAGIELVTSDSPPPSTQPLTPLDYRIAVDELKVTKVAIGFDDSAIQPPARLALEVDDFTLKNIVLDPANPNASMQIAAKMRAPGLANVITVNGKASPGAEEKTASLNVSASEIRPDALKPYLDVLGLESLLKNARFQADVQAGMRLLPTGMAGSAQFGNIQFADADQLFAMPKVSLAGVNVDTTTGMLDVGTVLLSGPTLIAQREASGAVQLLGMRFDPGRLPDHAPAVPSTQPAATQVAVKAGASPSLPRLRVGSLQWQDIQLQFVDHTKSPSSTISLANAGVELSDFLVDLESKQAGKPGKLKAWLEAPNFAERVDVDGTFTPSPGALATAITLNGKGFTAAGAKPYLASLGIEPVLTNGQFRVTINAGARRGTDTIDVELGITDAALADGDQELLGLDGLSVKKLSLGETLAVSEVQVDRPRATITRTQDGQFVAGGFKTVPLPPSTQPAAPEDPKAPLLPPLNLPLPKMVAEVKTLAVNGASVRWIDQALASPVDTTAMVDAKLNEFVYGREAAPANYSLGLKLKDSLDAMEIGGTLGASNDRILLTTRASGRGIRLGSLAAYLPPGMVGELQSGDVNASLDLAILPAAAGGTSANLVISDVRYADGERQFFKLDSFKVLVPRYDPVGGVVQVDEVSSAGLELALNNSAAGELKALGFALSSAAPSTQPVEQAAVEAPSTQPLLVATTGPAMENVADIVARARRPLPDITLKTLDLKVSSIKFTDESRAGSAPVELKDLKFANLAPIELGGKDPESRPPLKVQLTAKVDPVIGGIDITTTAAPFAQQPALTTEVLLSGINGAGLTQVAPEIAALIDGASLSAGEFRTHVEATAKYQRRGPYDFDLTRGFDLNLLIKDVAYRAAPETDVLLGLESLQGESIRIEPLKGNVIAKTIELNKPIVRALRDKEGIHLLGLTIRETTEPASTQPGGQTAENPPTAEPATPEKQSGEAIVLATGVRPTNEIRIDKFLINGADIIVEDRSTSPPLILPINNLDVEVRGLTNQALYEDKPIKFTALVNSGKTPLPKVAKGGIDESNLEDREIFAQVAMSGSVSLYPKLSGWAKTSVSGFEVLSLRGPASAFGVNIGGGMYDSTIDARVNETGKIDLRMRHVMTNLKMTEGDDGPVRKALKLPSPLNVVIGAMEDPDSSITLPVSVAVDQGEIKGIGSAAAGAVSSVVLTAVASAPVKVVGGITGLVGLTGAKGKPIDPVTIAFASGDTGVNPLDLEQLEPMLAVLRKEKTAELTLKGEIGGGDVQRAALRANPPLSDVSSIAASLRDQKLALMQERAALAGTARAQVATNDPAAGATLSQVREIDRQIASVEEAMDSTYDLLRPGAERQSDRRTRAAALRIAEERMEQLRLAILDYADLPADSDRVRVNRPSYAPNESDTGGTITVTLVAKKKE